MTRKSRILAGAVAVALVGTYPVAALAQVDPLATEIVAAEAAIALACVAGPGGTALTPAACYDALGQAIATLCAAASPGVPQSSAACLLAVSRSVQYAAILPVNLQARIGVQIGDVAEVFTTLTDDIFDLVEAAELPSLQAGATIGFSNSGPTSPDSASPA